MKRLLCVLVPVALMLPYGVAVADNHEGDEDANVASPMEMYACTYNDGKGPADLDDAIEKFNDWADDQEIEDYSAWTLVPFYSSAEQEFDVLWFGAADTARALGRVQDVWLSTGSEQAAFSDCSVAEGMTFDDLYGPLREWGKYKAEHGSTAGQWVFFPSFGGGNEDFDFKWVTTASSFEALGADWDQFNESGWEKANEMFRGKVSCDSSRAYVATTRRSGADDD
jgi:hypothetical protein